jgi:hypothetical protein
VVKIRPLVSAHHPSVARPGSQCPDRCHEGEPAVAARFLVAGGVPLVGLCAAVGQHMRWQNPDKQPDSGGNDEYVIEIANDGDEIRDQINRAERVGGDSAGQGAGVPWRVGMLEREPQGHDVTFEGLSPDFQGWHWVGVGGKQEIGRGVAAPGRTLTYPWRVGVERTAAIYPVWVQMNMPPEASMRWALTQRASSENRAAMIRPMSSA